MRAPDIAITQIVVEVLGLIILIRACISRERTFISGPREFFGVVISLVIVFVIFLAGIKVFETLPDFGTAVFALAPEAASQTYVQQGLQHTGAANLVSSVILDYRAYDTLGEATVLGQGAHIFVRHLYYHFWPSDTGWRFCRRCDFSFFLCIAYVVVWKRVC
jgi:multisubunit Na+/H+ antiporter MnhB subunit